MSRYRNFCFTSYVVPDLIPGHDDVIKYLIYQEEVCPTTSRHHWQGYCELKKQVSLSVLKDWLPGAHIEQRKGSAASAAEYCRKDESGVPNTLYEYGHISNPGKRTDLAMVAQAITEHKTNKEILDEFPGTFIKYHKGIIAARAATLRASIPTFRRVTTTVIYGPTGTGKTRTAYCTNPGLFPLPVPANNSLWFDGYESQDCLLLDDFTGWIKHSYLLRLLDGYPIDVPYKGGFVGANWTKVYITSNRHPSEWYPKHGLKPELIRRLTYTYLLSEEDIIEQKLEPSGPNIPYDPFMQ